LVPFSHAKAEIGTIKSIDGTAASIQRGNSIFNGKIDFNIESMDTVSTENSTINIDFKDNTKVTIKENSKLLIDDFVYDPRRPSTGKLALKIGMGTVRYASGQIAHTNPQSVDITTPTASIAVRGTDFNMTVDEIGRSLIVLVPSCIGNSCVTGKIEVSTLSGTVVLDQPYTATFTSQASMSPIQPVKIQNITDKQINNLLVIAVPPEVRHALRTQSAGAKSNETETLETQIAAAQKAKEVIDANHKTNVKQYKSGIVLQNKDGVLTAYTNDDPNNNIFIKFSSNSGDATINLQRQDGTSQAKVGNSNLNTITIRQSK
jgi:hypothetical protein